MRLGHVSEDGGDGSLHQGVGVEQDHGVLVEVLNDKLKRLGGVVVNDDPTASPARHAVDLTKRASRDDRNSGREIAKRSERTFFVVRKSVVDLIGDQGFLVFLGNRENCFLVLQGPARTVGVRGVVDQNGSGVGLDGSFEGVEIDFPLLLRVEIVEVVLDAEVFTDGLAQWEARSGNKNGLATLSHDGDGVVESTGASHGEEDVVGVDLLGLGRELLSDGLACGQATTGLCVAIVAFIDGSDDGFVDFLGDSETIGDGRFAETQVDHGQGVVLVGLHLPLEDLTDGVADISAQGRGDLTPFRSSVDHVFRVCGVSC